MTRPDFTKRAHDIMDILEVHDGDTFTLLLDGSFRSYPAPWLRLKDFSCPELATLGGKEARQATLNLLSDHTATAWVYTTKMPSSYADKLAKRYGDSPKSFARYLADVWLQDDVRLGDELVRGGFARQGAFIG